MTLVEWILERIADSGGFEERVEYCVFRNICTYLTNRKRVGKWLKNSWLESEESRVMVKYRSYCLPISPCDIFCSKQKRTIYPAALHRLFISVYKSPECINAGSGLSTKVLQKWWKWSATSSMTALNGSDSALSSSKLFWILLRYAFWWGVRSRKITRRGPAWATERCLHNWRLSGKAPPQSEKFNWVGMRALGILGWCRIFSCAFGQSTLKLRLTICGPGSFKLPNSKKYAYYVHEHL